MAWNNRRSLRRGRDQRKAGVGEWSSTLDPRFAVSREKLGDQLSRLGTGNTTTTSSYHRTAHTRKTERSTPVCSQRRESSLTTNPDPHPSQSHHGHDDERGISTGPARLRDTNTRPAALRRGKQPAARLCVRQAKPSGWKKKTLFLRGAQKFLLLLLLILSSSFPFPRREALRVSGFLPQPPFCNLCWLLWEWGPTDFSYEVEFGLS